MGKIWESCIGTDSVRTSGKAGDFFSDVWGVGIPIIPCQSSVARMMILELRKRMSLIDATWMCCHSVDAVLGGAS